MVDLAFRLQTRNPIPADHGYAIYGAISRILPAIHDWPQIGIHPIRGTQVGNRAIALGERSRLVIRSDTSRLPELIGLAGKPLNLGDNQIRIGIPEVRPLQPATALRSRLVTIKLDELTETAFMQGVMKQATDLGLNGSVQFTVPKRQTDNDSEPKPIRRTLRIKDKEIVGYELIVEGLSAAESLDLQRRGIGGRRKMGCGVFVPSDRKVAPR